MTRRWRILVVEDNATNVILFKDLLEGQGYDVKVARDGFEALDCIEAFAPHLVLMDIHLPRMDGLSVIKAIRSTPSIADTKILGLSAFAMESDVREAMAAGCNGYITKPISIHPFLEEIRNHLTDTT